MGKAARGPKLSANIVHAVGLKTSVYFQWQELIVVCLASQNTALTYIAVSKGRKDCIYIHWSMLICVFGRLEQSFLCLRYRMLRID